MRRIDAHGHEIGFHGFDHEEHMYTDRSTQEWIDVIHRAQDTFEKIIGKRAVGYVATSSDFQMDAPQIWHEQLGFRYSSSMRGDDRPYRTRFQGKESDFIEIPADGSWMTIQPSSTALPHRSPRARTGSPATGGSSPTGGMNLRAITARAAA